MSTVCKAKFAVGDRVVYVVHGLHITGAIYSRAYEARTRRWTYEVDSLESFSRSEWYEEDLTPAPVGAAVGVSRGE